MSEVRVVSGTIERPRVQSIIGRLRVGYSFQVGDSIVKGPAEISLDRKTAEAHLHKFDNYDEVLEFLGRPRTPTRQSPRERLENMIRENAKMNQLMAGAPEPSAPRTDSVAFKGAVKAEIQRLMPELVKMAADQVMEEMTASSKPVTVNATTEKPAAEAARK